MTPAERVAAFVEALGSGVVPLDDLRSLLAENARLRARVEELVKACEGLADQQAAPDDWWRSIVYPA